MRHRSLLSRAALLAGVALFASARPAIAADAAFLDVGQAFRGSAHAVDAHTLALQLDVAPSYHLYRERIAVDPPDGGARVGDAVVPHGQMQFDDTVGKNVEILRDTVDIAVPVQASPGDFRLRVHYQGCADAGLCYPPQTAQVVVATVNGAITQARWLPDDATAVDTPAAAATNEQAPTTAHAATTPTPPESSRIDRALHSGSLSAIAGLFMLAGLLLSFTPCVLPMVPILSSIIVGQGGPVSRSRGFALASAYSLGMALVYTAFGVVAGLLGEGLAAALQNPWVLGAFAMLLATLALSMFDVFELQMPGFVQTRLTTASSNLPGGRFVGVFVMGGLSALIVGPCVAAPLAGALVFISQTRDVVVGGLALFCLAVGMSVPLLLVGLSAGALLPRAGRWMSTVKTFFGVLLLAVALWIVAPVLPGSALMLVIGVAMLIAAAYLRLLDRMDGAVSGYRRLSQGVALVCAVLGVAQVVGALSGGTDPLRPLSHIARRGTSEPETTAGAESAFRRVGSSGELDQALKTAGRPVMLDFYADWCVSCKELAHLTFEDPKVRARLEGALFLQADVTRNTPEDKALLRRFGLFGPPGVLFFDPQGRERVDARVVGYVPPARFAESLGQVGL